MVVHEKVPLFFRHRDQTYLPTLRLLHRCAYGYPVGIEVELGGQQCYPGAGKLLLADPIMMRRVQVDEGAIRHVFRGADIMCPGLTSAGGRLEDGLEEGDPVVRARLQRLHPRPLRTLCCHLAPM